ncbi:MAG: AbrB/MazE/SpoVT family DNA-binding domain-containing protein [Anaerolineae bacterium]|nr:AbrB/MazE/SpoVT family DNA-binding domain-containing protein [Anaerolineae bacterium]
MVHSTVKTRIVKIGNSQGIRIPKPVLEQLGFVEEVELEIQPDQLIVRLPHTPRQNWEEHFQKMAQAGDDQLLDETASLTDWDEREWEW